MEITEMMEKYCSSKKADCSDCGINKGHKFPNCEVLLRSYMKGRADQKADIIGMLEREFNLQNNPQSKFNETIVLTRSFVDKVMKGEEYAQNNI